VVRHTGDEWRTVIENIAVLFWPLADRFLESLMLLPLLDEIFFVLERTTATIGFELHGTVLSFGK